MAKQSLDRNPEFKGRITEEFLADLYVNLPIITPQQLHMKDFPSDMEPPITGQTPEEFLKSIS